MPEFEGRAGKDKKAKAYLDALEFAIFEKCVNESVRTLSSPRGKQQFSFTAASGINTQVARTPRARLPTPHIGTRNWTATRRGICRTFKTCDLLADASWWSGSVNSKTGSVLQDDCMVFWDLSALPGTCAEAVLKIENASMRGQIKGLCLSQHAQGEPHDRRTKPAAA